MRHTFIAAMVLGLVTACASSHPKTPDVPAPIGPVAVGGGCSMQEFPRTCTLQSVTRRETSPGQTEVTATWRMSSGDGWPPSVGDDIPTMTQVPSGDGERVETFLRAHPSVGCLMFRNDPCGAPPPVVNLPPLPASAL